MQILFDGEGEVRAALQQRLAAHFAYAKKLLQFWLLVEKDKFISRSRLPPLVLRVPLAMSVKLCRQFRTVIELCERGESADGSVVARSMFESSMVAHFVLKPRFVPRRFDNKGDAQSTIKVPGVTLTREFRAALFVAHDALKPDREAARHAERRGMKRRAKKIAKIAKKANLADFYKQEIGQEWTEKLMKWPHTYSGLSIADLARSLGWPFPEWHDQVYSKQSEHVHPGDLLHHIQFTEDGKTTIPQWHGKVEHVRATLLSAIGMFFKSIGLIDRHILGESISAELCGFEREYLEMIQADQQA